MGSVFYTFDEAARRLGRSKRTIHNYIKQGFLNRVVDNGAILLRREDVEQLAVDLGSDAPALNRKTVYELQSRIRKLEQDMSVVRMALQIRDNPLRPSDEEASGFYKAAVMALKAGNWSRKEVELWVDYLHRIDEVTLDTFLKSTGILQPWKVFYDLCIHMMEAVSNEETYRTDLEWQVLHKKLDEVRKRMRDSIILWMEMGRGTLPDSALKSVDTVKEDLLRRISSSPGK